MPLFYLINDWAGRIEWLDAAMRFFVVGAVPLLWTLLAWSLLLSREEQLPPRRNASPNGNRWWAQSARANLLLATIVTALGCAVTWWIIIAMARAGWGTDIFSPRPFITHRVNLLLVEANDNSYPCIEVVLAAAAATLLWVVRGQFGRWAWSAVFLFGFARVFCGVNYPIDIGVGWLLGWAIATLSLSLRRAPLAVMARDGQRLVWSLRHQGLLSAAVVAMILGSAMLEVLGAPRAAIRAAKTAAISNASPHATPVGEGMPSGPSSNQTNHTAPLALDSEYGRQPRIEQVLARAIENLNLPHHIEDIEVAQITAGNSPYRVAGVRFLVQPQREDERRLVAQSAARIVRCVFAADAEIQSVDTLGVIFPPHGADAPHVDGEGGAILSETEKPRPLPVFTASVQRRNLRIINGPQWANAPGVDEGLWLRARSRLYIDPQVLADAAAAGKSPAATSVAPVPTASPAPTASPTATKKAVPVRPPLPVAPLLRAAPNATPKSTPAARATPTATQVRAAPRRASKRRSVRRRVKRRSVRRRATTQRRRFRR